MQTQLTISYNDSYLSSILCCKMTRLSIPLSAKPGKHRIAVDTVDLQQTTSLESATTSLTRQY